MFLLVISSNNCCNLLLPRNCFNKAKGNLGVNGSVSFMFNSNAVFGIKNTNEDQLWELFIENDIDVNEIESEDNQIMIYGPSENFNVIQDALKTIGIEDYEVAEISMIATDVIELSGEELERFEKLIDTLEDIDDVQEVYHNVNL